MQPTRNPNLTIPTVDAETTRTLHLPWTGKEPAECPGYQADGTLTSLPLPNLATCTREEVQAYFDNTWTLTEVLFQSLLTPEAFFSAPYHQLRHPMVFYYGHPPALYVNKLRVAGLIEGPLDAELEVLFETGVDEMSWDDMSKNEMEWPTVDAVLAYRRQVYQLVSKGIAEHEALAEGHAPITWEHPLWALFLGFEHERIHIETSSVLIRELPVHLVTRPAHWPADAPEEATRRGALQQSPRRRGPARLDRDRRPVGLPHGHRHVDAADEPQDAGRHGPGRLVVDAVARRAQFVVRRYGTALGVPSRGPLAPDGPDPGVLPPVDEVRFEVLLAQPPHDVVEFIFCSSREQDRREDARPVRVRRTRTNVPRQPVVGPVRRRVDLSQQRLDLWGNQP